MIDYTEAASTPNTPAESGPAGPRIRWAAIIWGIALAAVAGLALWITVDADRRAAVEDWMLALSPAAATAYFVLAIGAVALVAGIVGITRRAQRSLDDRRATDPTAG